MAVGPEPANGAVSNHRRRRFDVRVVPHRRRSPFRLRDWRMSTKLATVLVVPSMAFLLLAGVQTSALVGRTTALNDFSSQVGIGRQITAAVHQLQQERDRSAGELGELRRGGERETTATDLKPLQTATDRAVVDLRRAAEPLADADASWRVAFSEALEAYDQVVDIRPAIPPAVLSSETILSNYHRAIGALIDLLAEPTPGQDQPALNDAVLRYVQLARVKELSSRVRAQLYAAARAGGYGTEDRVLLADLRGPAADRARRVPGGRDVRADPPVRRDVGGADVRGRHPAGGAQPASRRHGAGGAAVGAVVGGQPAAAGAAAPA